MNKSCSRYAILFGILLFCFGLSSQVLANYVNVQDFGAVGNGVNDDTQAIQNALNTGNPVYFPKTQEYYKICGALTYSGHKIISNGAKIQANGPNYDILTISNSAGIYVGDLSIAYPSEQTNLNLSKNPLVIKNCTDILVERIVLKNGGSLLLENCNDGIIRKSQILNSAYMAFFISKSKKIKIKNCYAEKNISGFRTEQSSKIQIINSSVEDSQGGIRIEDSADVLIKDNLLRYCANGVTIYGPKSGYDFATQNVNIEGNILYHCYKTITVDKNEQYINNACEFALATKMFVENTLFLNNILIGNNESSLLTSLNSNVIFNLALPFSYAGVCNDTTGTSYLTMVPFANYIKLSEVNGQMPIGWLFYINFPSGVDLSQKKVLIMDIYWGGSTMWNNDTLSVKLYSEENRNNLICEIPLYMPYKESPLPAILWIPDTADVSSVKSIELCKKNNNYACSLISISDIRKGLKSKVGYLHSYLGAEVLNTTLDSNVFINHSFNYVSRKRYTAPAPTVITGTGISGTIAQRPALANLDWKYYATDLAVPFFWDGNRWLEMNTCWMSEKVNEAIHFDGTNYVELCDDARINSNSYTVEGWVKPESNSTERFLVQHGSFTDSSGFLISLYADNDVWVYQAVNNNFYALARHTDFPHDGKYHHIAVTFQYNGTNSNVELYLDGELKKTRSITGVPDFPAAGQKIRFGENFKGYMHGWNFYKRVLDNNEIEYLYKKGSNNFYTHWRFNEQNGSSEAKDYSPFGTVGTTSNNTGVLTNLNINTCRVDALAGTKGIEFDQTGYVDFGNNPSFNNSNYTVSAWIKPNSTGGATRIISKSDIAAPNGFLMQLYSGNWLYAYQSVNGNFYAVYKRTAFPMDGNFHHVAMTFSYDGVNSTLKLYLDGVLKQTGTAVGAPDLPLSTSSLECGKGFDGIIDEVKFYSRALSNEEVQKEFEMQSMMN